MIMNAIENIRLIRVEKGIPQKKNSRCLERGYFGYQ